MRLGRGFHQPGRLDEGRKAYGRVVAEDGPGEKVGIAGLHHFSAPRRTGAAPVDPHELGVGFREEAFGIGHARHTVGAFRSQGLNAPMAPPLEAGCRPPGPAVGIRSEKPATCSRAPQRAGITFPGGRQRQCVGLGDQGAARLQAISIYTGFLAERATRIASSIRKAAVEASRITTAWAVISLYTDWTNLYPSSGRARV